MPISIEKKDRYTTDDLLQIMRLLRQPDGCAWDRAQTHESIRTNLLEEAHEAIEAIDNHDAPALCEEMGDVLMQVVFHAQMAKEAGEFSYDDVVDGICKKLIVRHPHVFGEVQASTPEEVLKTWDAVKRQTKGDADQSDLLRHVPRTLPALMRAAKVQGRAARVGLDWDRVDGAMDALHSETDELAQAIAVGNPEDIADELGDVLFSAVNVSRFTDVDAELSLNAATDKFIRRFTVVEQLAKERGMDMNITSIAELDKLWAEAKNRLAADK